MSGPESSDLLVTFYDFQGQAIRLTRRQWDHVSERRPYMVWMEGSLQGTLEDPEEVRKSSDDPNTVKLYYRQYTNTPVGDKLVCVVVKFLENDAFILSAYVTTKIKAGELIWRKE